MDRVATVLQCQWRAYRRRFRLTGNLTTRNVGLLIVLAGLGAIRYFQQLPLAANQLANGETARYEALLIVVFLVWMLPVMGESKRSITPIRLVHLPLTTTELFAIRLGSIFCSPLAWIIMAGALALAYPLALAAHPFMGIIALLIFLQLGLLVGLTVTDLLHSGLARKLLLVAALVAIAAGGFVWLGKRAEWSASLKSLLPHRLAADAAVSSTPLSSIGVLVLFTVLFALLARWTFKFTLHPRAARRSQAFTFFGVLQLPGKFGGLIKKDLRYASRLLDLYLALPVVILFNVYLVSNPAPSAVALFLVVAFLFPLCLNFAFNAFGLDSSLGLDRYTLLPLSTREKLLSKNLAFAAVMIALYMTLVPLAFWKLGTRAVVLGFVELIVVWLAYASIGNTMSVKQPFKMQFYRFASGGSPVDALMGMVSGSIPALIIVFLLTRAGSEALWASGAIPGIALLLLIYLVVFYVSLKRASRALENRWEQLRRSLLD
ncbi:MAG: hypothetical protein LC794_00560 [Acidobacteria bacterium]|nr:hypothetical protein [Acidobacteriota bacterium]